MLTTQEIMSASAMQRTIESLAASILERHGNCTNLALIGIQRRGVIIARWINDYLAKQLKQPVAEGSLDISLYRDDWTTSTIKPTIHQTNIPFSVDEKNLILIDDVLYTGRTIRAALEALVDFGRPSKVELLVLIDRGHRELPIHADYIGLTQSTAKSDRVDVLVEDYDGRNEVCLVKQA